MKHKKKTRSHAKNKTPIRATPKRGGTLIGMQKTTERKVQPGDFPEQSLTYSPQETGQPDSSHIPDLDNPLGVQGGRGPTNQEGEGDRQNAQLAELDEVEPDIDLDKP